MTAIDSILWWLCCFTQAGVIGLLFYRRVWRVLPVFCIYCIWDAVSNLAASGIIHFYPKSYLTIYIVEVIAGSLLEFGVLVELAWSVLRPLRASLSRVALVVMAGLILALGAVIWPFAGLPGMAHAASRHWLFLVQLQQTVSILQVLIFLLLAAGSQLLSISWRDRELQVATGLGIFAMVSLGAAMLHMHQTAPSQYQVIGRVVVVSYFLCLLYWAVSFAQKQAERRAFTPQMQSILLSVAGAARSTRIALGASHPSKSRNPENR